MSWPVFFLFKIIELEFQSAIVMRFSSQNYLHIHPNAKYEMKVNSCLAFFSGVLCRVQFLLTGTPKLPQGTLANRVYKFVAV